MCVVKNKQEKNPTFSSFIIIFFFFELSFSFLLDKSQYIVKLL